MSLQSKFWKFAVLGKNFDATNQQEKLFYGRMGKKFLEDRKFKYPLSVRVENDKKAKFSP